MWDKSLCFKGSFLDFRQNFDMSWISKFLSLTDSLFMDKQTLKVWAHCDIPKYPKLINEILATRKNDKTPFSRLLIKTLISQQYCYLQDPNFAWWNKLPVWVWWAFSWTNLNFVENFILKSWTDPLTVLLHS